jgi:hypothetical protein
MTEPIFIAKVTPTLPPAAQRLVDIYDATPGSSGPYCCPAALAEVLDAVADRIAFGCNGATACQDLAAWLRGEGDE